MIKLVYHKPGTAPASLEVEGSGESLPPVISLIRYDASSYEEITCRDAGEAIALIDPSKKNWINVDGYHDTKTISSLASHFGLSPLQVEDIVTTQRPKAEVLEDGIFLATTIIYSQHESELGAEVEQLSMYFNRNVVLTFQSEKGIDPFEGVRGRLSREGTMVRKADGDFLAYALLDNGIDHFFPVLEMIGNESESLEEILIHNPTKAALKELFQNKRVLLEIRRLSWPLREVIGTLLRDDSGTVSDATKVFLRDCLDHLTQVIDITESFRDLTAGLMDIYHSSLSFRTNEIIRVLTLVSTFFIPLTFLAGVYGMNFSTESPWNMPELHWRFGYVAFWGLALLVGGGMFVFFRKKNWL
jgi:magnesium transporter